MTIRGRTKAWAVAAAATGAVATMTLALPATSAHAMAPGPQTMYCTPEFGGYLACVGGDGNLYYGYCGPDAGGRKTCQYWRY